MSQKLKFINTSQTAFFATARLRVDTYFKEKKITRNGNRLMWYKAACCLAGFFSLYILMFIGIFSVWVMLVMAAALGVFAACIGFNVCHDASQLLLEVQQGEQSPQLLFLSDRH